MSTTDLAQCSKCAALLNDTDEDIAKHRRWHAQFEQDYESTRRVASAASRDVNTLTATIRDLARPTPTTPPVALTIRVTDDDELEPDEDDLDALNPSYTDIATIEDPNAGEPDEDAIAAHPTIDRDDDLDTRLANATGALPHIP